MAAVIHIHVVNPLYETYCAWTDAGADANSLYNDEELLTLRLQKKNIRQIGVKNQQPAYVQDGVIIQLPGKREHTVIFPVKIFFFSQEKAATCLTLLRDRKFEVESPKSAKMLIAGDFREGSLISVKLNSFNITNDAVNLFSAIEVAQCLPYQVKAYICTTFFNVKLDEFYKEKLGNIILHGLVNHSKIAFLKEAYFLDACRVAASSGNIDYFIYLQEQCERLNLHREAILLAIEILAREYKSHCTLIPIKKRQELYFKIANAMYGEDCSLHSEDVKRKLKEGIMPREAVQDEKEAEEAHAIQMSPAVSDSQTAEPDSQAEKKVAKDSASQSLDPEEHEEALDDKQRLRYIMELLAQAYDEELDELGVDILRKKIFLQLAGLPTVSATTLKSLDLCDIAEFFAQIEAAKVQALESAQRAPSTATSSAAPGGAPILPAYAHATDASANTDGRAAAPVSASVKSAATR